MPKLKTHKTAAKRFKITGKGKIFRLPGSTSHLRRSESTFQHKRKETPRAVKKVDLKRIRRLINI